MLEPSSDLAAGQTGFGWQVDIRGTCFHRGGFPMRLLLIQPPQGTRFGFTKILMVEPLGLECVGATLSLHGHEVALIDLRLDRPSALRSALTRPRVGAVGISCGFTTDVYSTLWTARAVKDTVPGTPVFVGGHHASL